MMNLQNEHNADARVPVDPLVMPDFSAAADSILYAAEALRRDALELDRLAHKQRTRNDPGPAISAISLIGQVAHACKPSDIAANIADALGA
jgi:hypothetical protein